MLPAGVERHRFGVEEHHRMLESGALHEDDRAEPIGGAIEGEIGGQIAGPAPAGWRHGVGRAAGTGGRVCSEAVEELSLPADGVAA